MADFSAAAFLSVVLGLTARDGNVAVIPEAARFAIGGKPVLRIVASSRALDEYLLAMDRVGVIARHAHSPYLHRWEHGTKYRRSTMQSTLEAPSPRFIPQSPSRLMT